MAAGQRSSATGGLGAVWQQKHYNILLFLAVDEGDENPTR